MRIKKPTESRLSQKIPPRAREETRWSWDTCVHIRQGLKSARVISERSRLVVRIKKSELMTIRGDFKSRARPESPRSEKRLPRLRVLIVNLRAMILKADTFPSSNKDMIFLRPV